MTRAETRRLRAVEAMFAESAPQPVTICICVVLLLEDGRPLWTSRILSACGEHPQSGVMCGRCHSAHDKRVDITHQVHTADLTSCVRCDEEAALPENEGWVDIALPNLTVQAEIDETPYDLGPVVIAVNIADRLCEACRAQSP